MFQGKQGNLPLISLLVALFVSIVFFSFMIFQLVLLDNTEISDEQLQIQLLSQSINDCFSDSYGVLKPALYSEENLNSCINEAFMNQETNPIYFRIYLQALNSSNLQDSLTKTLYPHETKSEFQENQELCTTVDTNSCDQYQITYPLQLNRPEKTNELIALHIQLIRQ